MILVASGTRLLLLFVFCYVPFVICFLMDYDAMRTHGSDKPVREPIIFDATQYHELFELIRSRREFESSI